MAKRVLFFVLAVFVALFASATQVSAQGEGFGPQYDADLRDSYNQAIQNCGTPSLECLVHHVFKYIQIEVANSPYAGPPPQVNGGSSPNSDAGTGNAVASGAGGAVYGFAYLIGEMYKNPAASTHTYVADLMNSAGIATPAYAQGLGFASLDPILELWKVFRNISYIFFVVIFIVIGFLIMFRQRVGGQAAITAQQAIPSIIISLIFVTFSYAIAGFLIDLMYLTMYMMLGLFDTSTNISGDVIDYNIFQLMGELWKPTVNFGDNIDIVTNLLASMVNFEALSTTLGFVGGITLTLVLAVAVLIGTFKLFFELLKSYATVILEVVTAPLRLMMGAIPGRNVFVPWIKNIVGNLIAFPTVLFVIILFYQFTNLGSATDGGFMPPFLLGRGQQGAIATLMGLALILALPEIVKDIKKKVGATEGFGSMVFNAAGANMKQAQRYGLPGYGALAGGAYGAGKGLLTSGGGLWNRLSEAGAGMREHGGKGLKAGQSASRLIEQVSEGKFLDPNSWENVLLNQQREAQRKAAEEARKKRETETDSTPG